MYQSKDTLNPPQAGDPRGQYENLLDRLDARLDDLYSTLTGLARKLQCLCQSIHPILAQLEEALSRVDAATGKSLPALLQAISRGARQGVEHCQSVHALALQQQANAERVLITVSGVFARICASTATVLGHLVSVLQERAKLDRPPAGRGGVPGMKVAWQHAELVSDHAGSLLLLQRERESIPSTGQLREELGRLTVLLAMSHALAEELMVLAV